MSNISAKKPITEKQHFVPKFYTKRFANERGFVSVLNIKKVRIEPFRPYASVCYEKFYYAVTTGVPDDVSQIIEELFRQIEDDISGKLDGIYQKLLHYESVTESERYTIATLASMLYLRGGYMRGQIKRMDEEFYKHSMKFRASQETFSSDLKEKVDSLGEREISLEDVDSYKQMLINEEYGLEFNNASHLNLLGEMRGFANLFYGKNWMVHIAKGESDFFTSDTPVVEFIPERTGFYGASFLERTHYFALGPKVVIEFIYPHSRKRLKRKWADDKKVFDINTLRLNLSMKEAYGARREEFEEQIKKKPMTKLDRMLRFLSLVSPDNYPL